MLKQIASLASASLVAIAAAASPAMASGFNAESYRQNMMNIYRANYNGEANTAYRLSTVAWNATVLATESELSSVHQYLCEIKSLNPNMPGVNQVRGLSAQRPLRSLVVRTFLESELSLHQWEAAARHDLSVMAAAAHDSSTCR